jgi:hypothetical protein
MVCVTTLASIIGRIDGPCGSIPGTDETQDALKLSCEAHEKRALCCEPWLMHLQSAAQHSELLFRLAHNVVLVRTLFL